MFFVKLVIFINIWCLINDFIFIEFCVRMIKEENFFLVFLALKMSFFMVFRKYLNYNSGVLFFSSRKISLFFYYKYMREKFMLFFFLEILIFK